MTGNPIPPGHALQQAMIAPWRSQCLYAAARLDLAELIGQGIDGLAALAQRVGLSEDRLGRLLRFLVASGTFAQHADGRYANTAISDLLREGPGSQRDMVLLYAGELYHSWGRLFDALGDTRPGFELAHGQGFYAYLEAHPEVSQRFQHTLQSRRAIFEQVPALFDLRGSHFVDIGGGSGELSRAILQATPSASAVVLDLAPALAVARDNLAELIDAGRAQLLEGDMLAALPAGANLYLLSRVLGDLDDQTATRLLRNCRQAMGSEGRLLVIEQLVAAHQPSELAALWDLHLFMVCQGRQRTQADLERLLASAGLSLQRQAELPLGMSLLTILPAA